MERKRKTNSKPVVNKILPIACKRPSDFFRRWIEFLAPIHHLTGREQDVLSTILFNMHEVSKTNLDTESVEKIVMGKEGRSKLMKELNMSQVQLTGILTKLCRAKILKVYYTSNDKIDSYRISPSFIPNYSDNESFKLMLVFQTV